MAKYYRVVLINKETGERQLTICKYRSLKKAIEWATKFCASIPNNVADFEIKTF